VGPKVHGIDPDRVDERAIHVVRTLQQVPKTCSTLARLVLGRLLATLQRLRKQGFNASKSWAKSTSPALTSIRSQVSLTKASI
jgi:hypothetical protein